MTCTARDASISPILGMLRVAFLTTAGLLFANAPIQGQTANDAALNANCRLIELSRPTSAESPARPDRGSLHQTAVTRRFEANSTQCWSVDVQGFEGEGVVVAVTAAGYLAGHQLAQLTAVLADDSEGSDTAVVIQPLPDDIPRATWYYVMPDGQRTRVLLANAATEPVPPMAVTFTALRSVAWVGNSTGPPAADLAGLPELNSVFGLVSPTGHMGLADHCLLSFRALSPGTGDRVDVFLAHRGRIGPGVYEIVGADNPNKFVEAVDVPGRATGVFSIGAGNALAGGLAQSFSLRSGVLEITSVSDRLVQGVVRANGWRNPARPRGDPEGLPELSMVASFAVVANDRGERLASETRIHRLSYAAIWRRWTHECLQQPPPPVATADDSDEAEQDPADRPGAGEPRPDEPEPPGGQDPSTPATPQSAFCWKNCVPVMFCWKDCVPGDGFNGPADSRNSMLDASTSALRSAPESHTGGLGQLELVHSV